MPIYVHYAQESEDRRLPIKPDLENQFMADWTYFQTAGTNACKLYDAEENGEKFGLSVAFAQILYVKYFDGR
jgi:hypothetical protein